MPPILQSSNPMKESSQMPTRVLTKMLFFVFGIIFILLLFVIGLATAITKSSWWIRKRRACQRRIDHLGLNKTIQLMDRAFYVSDICLSALSIHWSDSETKFKPSLKSDQIKADSTDLPLRFKPETLYGATTTVHRENMRKRSWSNLDVQLPGDGQRRASMIDSLSFINSANCSKTAKSSDEASPHIPRYNLAYPQLNLVNHATTKWSPVLLPQIDVTCDSDSLLLTDDTDGIDGSRSDREGMETQNLSIAIPIRRASATNIKLSNLIESQRESCMLPTSTTPKISLTTDSAKAKVESECDLLEQDGLKPSQPNLIKRNSLIEGLSGFTGLLLRRNSAASLTDDESSNILMKSDLSTTVKLNQSERKMSLNLIESPIKIPQLTSGQAMESPAGHLAICVQLIEDKATLTEKLSVRLLSAKQLKSIRPWQKSTFILRCTYRSLNHVQQSSLLCKDCEFGRLHFPISAQFTFDACLAEQKQQLTTMNQLKISIVESGSKWSTEKEHLHGTVTLQLPGFQVLTGKPEWYPVSAIYPIVRIKADLLVSLCQRPLDGFMSVGIHEIRNIDIQMKGSFYISDLPRFASFEQSGFDIHACLTYDGHLLKSKRSVFLQQDRRASTTSLTQSSSEKRMSLSASKHRMSFSRMVSGEHYLQFSLPTSKKSSGKLCLSNYGIVLFVTHKLAITDQLPADFVNQLKLVGAPEPKSIHAVGECFIADETTQDDYWRKVSFNAKCDSQCAVLWNDAVSHECSRVYQWLTTN